MKRIAATLFTLCLVIPLHALPIGNPWQASLLREDTCDIWSVRFGFYGDYVFNHDLKNTSQPGNPTIHDAEIYTNAGYLTLNLWDRVDLFSTLGATRIEIQSKTSAFGAGDNTWIFIESETAFSWSIGARATIWECGCLGTGIEAQYQRSCPELNFLKDENLAPLYQDNVFLNYREWQIGLGAAYRINIDCCYTALIPYLGVKWNRATINHVAEDKLRSNRCFGYAIGVTLLCGNKGTITVEGRFLNEKAVHVNAQARF